MSYTLPTDVDDRPVAIDGAGSLGRRIAAVYAAGGTDVHIFDLSPEQREAARDYAVEHINKMRKVLDVDDSRTGRVEAFEGLGEAIRGA
jgi:3-hydroxybutyryl-CoA dehydrogenase